MFDAEASRGKPIEAKLGILHLAAGVAVAIAATGVIMMASPKPAAATPAIGAQTGYACGQCHVTPSGGELNRFGRSWAKHHK